MSEGLLQPHIEPCPLRLNTTVKVAPATNGQFVAFSFGDQTIFGLGGSQLEAARALVAANPHLLREGVQNVEPLLARPLRMLPIENSPDETARIASLAEFRRPK